jgi:glycosyltransferase involved in cell wall biosynthesis
MKILFISRSGKQFVVLPFIQRQFESLRKENIDVKHYVIKEEGIKGYINAWKHLINHKNTYDIIHAHYAYSFYPVVLSFSKAKKVISFMGSDLYGVIGKGKVRRIINIVLSQIVAFLADFIIVKSEEMKTFLPQLYYSKVKVIPNGVDLNKFKKINKKDACKKLNLPTKNYLLFLGDTQDRRKNFQFIIENKYEIEKMGYEILTPYPVDPDLVPLYINISDALVMPSLKEGSPNVIKETLACGKPFLSTDVGDVRELVEYSNLSSLFSDSSDFIDKLAIIKDSVNRTQSKFYEDYSTESIAKKIVSLYKNLL